MTEHKHRPFVRVAADHQPMIYLHPEMPETCGVEVTTVQERPGTTRRNKPPKYRQIVRFLTTQELAESPKVLTRRPKRR